MQLGVWNSPAPILTQMEAKPLSPPGSRAVLFVNQKKYYAKASQIVSWSGRWMDRSFQESIPVTVWKYLHLNTFIDKSMKKAGVKSRVRVQWRRLQGRARKAFLYSDLDLSRDMLGLSIQVRRCCKSPLSFKYDGVFSTHSCGQHIITYSLWWLDDRHLVQHRV